ncbi:MAG: hypothetical protein LBG80_09780 [Bacteroidales bacterium]|nr:hypothetical protein [Bacteroidales bacterium]
MDIPHCSDFAKNANYEDFAGVLGLSLTRFCKLLDKPLVILFDEADCLSEDTLELKIRYGDKYIEKGLKQTARYVDFHCCNEGWMVVFDRRSTVNWEDKLYMKKETVDGKIITIVGV